MNIALCKVIKGQKRVIGYLCSINNEYSLVVERYSRQELRRITGVFSIDRDLFSYAIKQVKKIYYIIKDENRTYVANSWTMNNSLNKMFIKELGNEGDQMRIPMYLFNQTEKITRPYCKQEQILEPAEIEQQVSESQLTLI